MGHPAGPYDTPPSPPLGIFLQICGSKELAESDPAQVPGYEEHKSQFLENRDFPRRHSVPSLQAIKDGHSKVRRPFGSF